MDEEEEGEVGGGGFRLSPSNNSEREEGFNK